MTDIQQPTRGLMRRVVIRGGPGSGHHGHAGRPGEVGGSLPSDFHSAEGDAPGFNAAGLADETGIAGSEWSAEDQKWVENWLSENLRSPSGDELFNAELFIGPSGKPYDVNYVASDGLPFGHEEVGARAFRALVDARHRNPEAAETVEIKDLTFEEVPQDAPSPQWETIHDDERRKVFEFNPYPMEFAKGPVWNFMAYPDTGFEVWHGRLETENYREDHSLLGGTPFVGTAEMMKKRVVEMMFPIVNEWNVKNDIYDYGEITEWRPVAALDPDKPFSVNVRGYTRNAGSFSGDFETLDDAKKAVQDALNKAASRDTIGGIGSRAVNNGETAMLALGFMRVSRGGTTSGGGSGFNWDGNVKLTDAQRRVATKIARHQIENQRPEFAWESGVRWGEATEWPSNDFVLALQTTGPSRITERSFLEMSEWARAVLIGRGGAGSGHFGHEGRPGQVGGSQPGDFHSAESRGGRSSDLHSATEALKVPRTEKWKPVVGALETIDSVHGIDSVPLNLKVTLLSPTSMNVGHLRVERGPGHFAIKNMALRILPEGETPNGIPQHLEFTVAHEFGHLLDWSAFREIQRSGGDWGDYDKPVQGSRAVWYLGAESKGMYGVMKAIKLSKAYDALKVDTMPYRAWPGSKVKLIYDRDTMRYLREPEELFARAYAQYVAVRSGDERMLKGVKDYQDGAKAGHPPMAWEDKDFQPIAAAFDSMFGERNWR
jgi:hypothetical protein